ncbi:MAG: protein disulfide oxidoreductase [Hydrogenophilales bacterium]|nr:protein disulfide oxidoreductase [Hydrogenophilales bacterium]
MSSPVRFSPRWWLRLVAELLLFLVFLLALEWFMTRHAARGPAPALAAMQTDGRGVDVRSLQGRPALVYFWATWCPVCTAQQSAIDGVLADTPAITVAMRSGGAAEIHGYLAKDGLNWPVIDDADGAISMRWGVSGVPAAFILDADGRIRFVTRGYTTGLGLRARLWLAGLGV